MDALTQFIRNKKVLIVGLGRLGGGIAAVKFFARHSAHVTVTDALSKQELSSSIKKLKDFPLIRYRLGGHDVEDFIKSDWIVFNPAVPIHSEWVKHARALKKPFFNDLSFFLHAIHTVAPYAAPYIAITGTRGKTTTTTWISHLIKPSYVGGNMPTKGLFTLLDKIVERPQTPVVLELSSFQLEFMAKTFRAPHIAVVTNLYQDHLNRHGTMKEYASVKSNIFSGQKKDDVLIANYDVEETRNTLGVKPKGKCFYVSTKKLPKGVDGMYAEKGFLYFRVGEETEKTGIKSRTTTHETYNIMIALCAAHAHGISWNSLKEKEKTLPTVAFRQQIIKETKSLLVVNDSAATSPEGAIAAIDRFAKRKISKKPIWFIMGGTDKQLQMAPLAKKIKENISPKQIVFLEGSGTKKLLSELKKRKYEIKNPIQDSLEGCILYIKENVKNVGGIVLSPGSASFEKFKNEFNRGRVFNKLIQKHF